MNAVLPAINRAEPAAAGVPRHVAIIMDGNGRWARRRGKPRLFGHRAGTENIRRIVHACVENNVKYLTVYAFSTENWRRPADEVRFLIGFNESILLRRRDELNEHDVRIRFAGRRDWRVPKRLIRQMDEAAALTARNRTMTLPSGTVIPVIGPGTMRRQRRTRYSIAVFRSRKLRVIRKPLMMYARRIDSLLQIHFVIDDIDDHLQNGIDNCRSTGTAEHQQQFAVLADYGWGHRG